MTTARTSRSVLISACAVPVLVVGQFAMLAIVPVALVVSGTLRNKVLRSLRPWAALLAAVYAIPLALWAIGPDRAPSLSKDMHPVFVPLISVAAVAVIVVLAKLRRRSPAVVKG
jgi:cytochrome bd-type quinol oxidase subunit 2